METFLLNEKKKKTWIAQLLKQKDEDAQESLSCSISSVYIECHCTYLLHNNNYETILLRFVTSVIRVFFFFIIHGFNGERYNECEKFTFFLFYKNVFTTLL